MGVKIKGYPPGLSQMYPEEEAYSVSRWIELSSEMSEACFNRDVSKGIMLTVEPIGEVIGERRQHVPSEIVQRDS